MCVWACVCMCVYKLNFGFDIWIMLISRNKLESILSSIFWKSLCKSSYYFFLRYLVRIHPLKTTGPGGIFVRIFFSYKLNFFSTYRAIQGSYLFLLVWVFIECTLQEMGPFVTKFMGTELLIISLYYPLTVHDGSSFVSDVSNLSSLFFSLLTRLDYWFHWSCQRTMLWFHWFSLLFSYFQFHWLQLWFFIFLLLLALGLYCSSFPSFLR